MLKLFNHCTMNCMPTEHCLALVGLTSLHEESSCCAGRRSLGFIGAGSEDVPLGPGGVESCASVVLEEVGASPLSHRLLAKLVIRSLLVRFLFHALPIGCEGVWIAGAVVPPPGSCSASIVLLQLPNNKCRIHTYRRKYVEQWYLPKNVAVRILLKYTAAILPWATRDYVTAVAVYLGYTHTGLKILYYNLV